MTCSCSGLLMTTHEALDGQIGDILRIDGNPQPFALPVFPYQFDEKKYADSRGWSFRLWVRESVRIDSSNEKFMRWKLEEQISSWPVGDRVKAFYKAMLLGLKSDLDRSDKSDFANAGLVHILAVSGLHVGLIALMLQFIVKFITHPKWKWIRSLLVISGLWGFAHISGMSESVIRASLLFSLLELARASGEKGSTSEAVWMAGFLILLFDPDALFSLGFQLSFAAVFGIVYGHSYVQQSFFSDLKGLKKRMFEGLSVSLWAQFATTPLSLFYFHRFPNYFLLSNLLLLPLVPFLLMTGVATLVIDSVLILPSWYWHILDAIVEFFFEVVTVFSELPGAVSEDIFISVLQAVTLGLGVVVIILILHKRLKWGLYFLPMLAIGWIDFQPKVESVTYQYQYKGVTALEVWEGDRALIYMDDTTKFDRLDWASKQWRRSYGIKEHSLAKLPKSYPKVEGDTLMRISTSAAP